MTAVVDEELNESEPVAFAGNVLEIAVFPEAEGEVTTIEDFTDEALLHRAVRRGGAVRRLRPGGVRQRRDHPVDRHRRARRARLLAKVETGDLDAGIVYHTDVLASGGAVMASPFPTTRTSSRVPDRHARPTRERPRPGQGVRRLRALRRGQEILESVRVLPHRERPAPAPARDPARARGPAGRARPSSSWSCRSWALLQRGALGVPRRPLSDPLVPEALRLSRGHVVGGHGPVAGCSASRWRGCWPGPPSRVARWLRAIVFLPMVLPPVVGGAALLFALGRRGLVGGRALRRQLGFLLPFSTGE